MSSRATSAAVMLVGLAGCSVDSVLVLQLLDGADSVTIQVFDDSACAQPFVSEDGAMFGDDLRVDGPLEDGARVGLPVAPGAQGRVVRIELEARDGFGGMKRWCACPRLPNGGEVSTPIPVRAASGTPDECQVINLDDVTFSYRETDEPCVADFECRSHNCECTTADCASLTCSDSPCPCGYRDGDVCVPLPEGSEDPDDCLGDGECVAGECRLGLGSACGTGDACATDACLCLDADCAQTACVVTDCATCQYGTDGDCAGDVVDGARVPDCFGACVAGECVANLDIGQGCHVGTECARGLNCVCVTADCIKSECHAVSQLEDHECEYFDPGSGAWSATPDGDRGEGCGDGDHPGMACAGGACMADNGSACESAATCVSGNCECADDQCNTKRCSAVECDCQLNLEGDSGCDGPLAPGVDDSRDSCGAGQSCFDGACRLESGETCTLGDDECVSGNCECADGDCQVRVCHSAPCATCDFLSLGVCVDTPEGNRGTDCMDCGADGSCRTDLGTPCTGDDQCSTGQCECASSTCQSRVCAAATCACRFDMSGGCLTPLTNGSDDPEDCEGPLGCYDGGCLLDSGASCTGDAQCGYGHCECASANCGTRKCADADCVCGWSADGLCTFPLDGVEDEPDCASDRSCVAGACKLNDGVECTGNGACASGICECTDPACSARVCSPVDCECQVWNGANCAAILNDGDEPEDCAGPSSCYSGSCRTDIGQLCTQDSDCGANHCQCGDPGCNIGQRVCTAEACQCRYDSDGDGSCAADSVLNDGVQDSSHPCAAASACYDGTCKLDDGQACTFGEDDQCGHRHCECADDNCDSYVCHASACATCQWVGGGICRDTPLGNDGEACEQPTTACDGTAGSGACRQANGESCNPANGGSECASGICECGDASCSPAAMVCQRVACDCRYDSAGDGSCATVLDEAVADPGTCDGADEGCYAGVCKGKPGAVCVDDGDCGSNLCADRPGNTADTCCDADGPCVVDISAGANFTCAVRRSLVGAEDGAVWCWGAATEGRLGIGGIDCDLSTAGNQDCWVPTRTLLIGASLAQATAISAGTNHACAVLRDTTIACWGSNGYRQIGNGSAAAYVPAPTQVIEGAAPLSAARWVTAGLTSSCAVAAIGSEDRVECWGGNPYGQLGIGSTGGNFDTAQVTDWTVGATRQATSVDVGDFHSCSTLDDGTGLCWGEGGDGQLGVNDTRDENTPVQVCGSGGCPTPLGNVARVSSGNLHTCAVGGSGVSCWGFNNHGQLGTGDCTPAVDCVGRRLPVAVSGLPGVVVAVSAGGWHTCTVMDDGTGHCWGRDDFGQLGNDAAFSSSATPARVDDLALGAAVSISAGGSHTCAILVGGQARCWGQAQNGRLGIGTVGSAQPLPVEVAWP